MKSMIDDETLDRQLRDAAPYIDDEGFTARVLANLPAARRRPSQLRTIILISLTVLGCVIAYLLSGGGRLLVSEGMMELSSFPIWMLLIFAFGCGLLVGAVAVIFAIRKTPEVHDDLARLRF
jgi:hypothetical protein